MRNIDYAYDKRSEERIHFPIRASLADSADIVPVRAINTSRNGALIDAPTNYRVGARIYLQFDTDLASLPVVAAEVVRSQPASFGSRVLLGVKFTEPNPSLTDMVKLEKRLEEGRS